MRKPSSGAAYRTRWPARSKRKMPLTAAVVVLSVLEVAVISYEYWQKHFSGSTDALGHKIRVNNYLLSVVGATPEQFQGTVLGLDFSHLDSGDARARSARQPGGACRSIAARLFGHGTSQARRIAAAQAQLNAFLRRIPAQMFAVLGPLLLVLAAIGIYAVVSYSIAQRTTEIGVRLAVGATVHRVILQIAGETLRVVFKGIFIG